MSLLGGFVAVAMTMGLLTAGLVIPAVGVAGQATNNSIKMFNQMPADFQMNPLAQQSRILASDGTVIGTVAALPGDSGVDAVKIALADDVDVVGEWSVRETATVEPGETVYTHGSSVPLGEPNSISAPEPFNIGEVCGDVYTCLLYTSPSPRD